MVSAAESECRGPQARFARVAWAGTQSQDLRKADLFIDLIN